MKVIQICAASLGEGAATLFALCDDGSIWMRIENGWKEVSTPQRKKP